VAVSHFLPKNTLGALGINFKVLLTPKFGALAI